MRQWPLAFHITFGTYGARLHGDPRGTVALPDNRHGDPIVRFDAEWSAEERARLHGRMVILTNEQRQCVERVMPSICERGGWHHLIAAAARDHVHTLLVAEVDGVRIRRWLKRWVGDALSQRWPDPTRSRWLAKGGSARQVWSNDYLETAFEYIRRQRISPFTRADLEVARRIYKR
ncbi:MAG: hypothetical protein ACF8PN_09330 [Phycisphaerales bacterium]